MLRRHSINQGYLPGNLWYRQKFRFSTVRHWKLFIRQWVNIYFLILFLVALKLVSLSSAILAAVGIQQVMISVIKSAEMAISSAKGQIAHIVTMEMSLMEMAVIHHALLR